MIVYLGHIIGDINMAWNPDTGFYISPAVLNAPWDDEVAKLPTRVGQHNKPNLVAGVRDFDSKITWLSFKSKDGDKWTKPAIKGKGEIPEDYKWTEVYYENPILKSVIDWFPVEKTRVRLARENPGSYVAPHFDWDNLLHGFDKSNQIVRIWVQLDDTNVWYRLTNGVDDVSVKLQRGQWLVLNVDTVIHATQNHSDKPRSNLIIHAKMNSWLRTLPDLFQQHKILDPRTDDPQY